MASRQLNNLIILRGRVEFPTGGDEAQCFKVRDPVAHASGGSSEILEPTVKVWMGEGSNVLMQTRVVQILKI